MSRILIIKTCYIKAIACIIHDNTIQYYSWMIAMIFSNPTYYLVQASCIKMSMENGEWMFADI